MQRLVIAKDLVTVKLYQLDEGVPEIAKYVGSRLKGAKANFTKGDIPRMQRKAQAFISRVKGVGTELKRNANEKVVNIKRDTDRILATTDTLRGERKLNLALKSYDKMLSPNSKPNPKAIQKARKQAQSGQDLIDRGRERNKRVNSDYAKRSAFRNLAKSATALRLNDRYNKPSI